VRTRQIEEPILEKVRTTISTYNLLDGGERVVIGVSGGPDSVALLHLLYSLKEEYRISLHIAHLNHRLRGKASEEEEEFVRGLAKRLGLPFSVKGVDIRERCKDSPFSIEVQARRERYLFFEEVANSIGAEKIALAHQADDVIETVIMDLIRGSGLRGLRGIPPIRKDGENVWIIRPLIRIHREEIEGYLKFKKLRYFIDRSNIEPINLRNRIRLTLIPKLEEYNPNFRRTFLRSIDIWRRDENYLRKLASNALERITIERKRGEILLGIEDLRREDEALQFHILREALLSVRESLDGFGSQHIESILNLAKKGPPHGRIDLPYGVKAEREYEKIGLYAERRVEERRGRFYQYLLNIPGKIAIDDPPLLITTQILSIEDLSPKDPKKLSTNSIVYIDYEAIEGPLLLRPRLEGDWFRPLGIKGRKKVKDFFMDLKVPIAKRQRIPLLVDRGGIIWVLGYRIDERVKITDRTKKVLKIEYREEIAG
jgi:tRNA(Ile)-lysidine synthase